MLNSVVGGRKTQRNGLPCAFMPPGSQSSHIELRPSCGFRLEREMHLSSFSFSACRLGCCRSSSRNRNQVMPHEGLNKNRVPGLLKILNKVFWFGIAAAGSGCRSSFWAATANLGLVPVWTKQARIRLWNCCRGRGSASMPFGTLALASIKMSQIKSGFPRRSAEVSVKVAW